MPENLPGITDNTKRRITQLASRRLLARGTTDGNLIASIINRQKKGAADSGAAWLLGVLGPTVLDIIERTSIDVGPGQLLNKALLDATSRYGEVNDAQLSFTNGRALFLMNGKSLIAY